MKKLSPLMFQGTGSDVGKTVITAAFCRIFLQDGYQPAPFKAQNMSNNACITEEGLEMSHAQLVQAEAACIPCHVDMNPLMLKPSSDKKSDVILLGKPIGRQDAYTYFRSEGREFLREEVHKAFDRLSERYTPIVLEGAGSISEINLRESDLVNMPMAVYAKAPVILIADIERGGVFASLYGSIMLLPPEERKFIKGIIINKFRGDLRLFTSGIEMIEEICQVPVLGVIPYFNNIEIEEEDSLQLAKKSQVASSDTDKVNIVVILTKYLTHFTEFSLLARDPRIHLFYSDNPSEIEKADIVIIPNSQSPIGALTEYKHKGIDQVLKLNKNKSQTIIGLGTGYYLMGEALYTGEERHAIEGLKILPIMTRLSEEATLYPTEINFLPLNMLIKDQCYLMTNGTVECTSNMDAFLTKSTQFKEGFALHDRYFGTAVHGLFNHGEIIDFFLKDYTDKTFTQHVIHDYKDQQYNLLADHIRTHVNIEKVYDIMQKGIEE